MPKQIIIAEQHRIAAVFSEDQIQELVVATGNHQVSDIYLGIVENVLSGIDAAFVNIGDPERNGFIHVSDLGPVRLKRNSGAITELLTPQQKVLVQIMKEPTGNKGPRLTGNISLPGRYLVLMPYGKGVNLSRRLTSESERNRLRALAILIKPAGMGLLVRTEAQGMEISAIVEDLETLQAQWELIQQEASSNRPPALLNRDNDFIQRVLRDMYNADVNRIVVDSSDGVRRVKQHLVSWSGSKTPQVSIDHHREAGPILEYFRVNAAIREALRPRVDLPSGGYIIIQPTEALTVIDVNSGSFTRSATARETVLWTNCEAATEIARQLRLRNVAGVIIVDFIDMDSRRDQLQVLEHFNKVLRADKARPQISQLSELGLVELTRKRQGQNIYELFGSPCPTCNGLGHLVSLPGEGTTQSESPKSGVVSVPPVEAVEPPSPAWSKTPQLASSGNDATRPSWESSSDWESEAKGNVPEVELLNHPSYQESTRGRHRRHRHRVEENVGPIAEDESMGLAVGGAAGNNFPRVSDTYQIASRQEVTRSGRSPREIVKPVAEPPEIVNVEMTREERDVYALMGISPLIMVEDDSLKNRQGVVVEVVEPGEGGTAGNVGTDKAEALDAEDSPDSQEPESNDSPTLLSDEAADEPEAPEDDDSENEEEYEEEDEDEEEDEEIEGESEGTAEQPKVVRRRRRRSSASIDE
ncbi:MAG: Rne/Rng family ribonuclease [Cyanobacteriota bacterium]|nr:Rne/Rng family ribonuclease [Cyanobacteriota bacterium]